MNHPAPQFHLLALGFASIAGLLLAGCASAPQADLADGASVRALIEQQTHDPGASARNGTATPQGTDPDVANGAVEAVRAPAPRATGGMPRGTLMDLLGSGSR